MLWRCFWLGLGRIFFRSLRGGVGGVSRRYLCFWIFRVRFGVSGGVFRFLEGIFECRIGSRRGVLSSIFLIGFRDYGGNVRLERE